MNEIKIFENAEMGVQVRTTMNESNEPLFCLVDVAKALEYKRPADAVTQHCKNEGVSVLPTPTTNQYGAIVMQDIKFGNEGQVFRLVMKSRCKRAVAFQDWVCDEVLPSIRKTGKYESEESKKTQDDLLRFGQAIEYATVETMKQILNIRPGSAKSLRIQRWLNEKYNLGQNLPTEEQFKAQKRAARIKRLEQRLAYLKGMGKTPRINREF